MTGVRRLQVMDSLNQTAKDLVNYVLSAKREELTAILEEVKQKYQPTWSIFQPVSLLQKALHSYSRQRTPAINNVLDKVRSTDADSYALLDTLADFMSSGNFEPTSANTLLLIALIEKHPKYNSVDEDGRYGNEDLSHNAFKMGIIKSLKETFVAHAKKEVEAHKNMQNLVKPVELPEPKKLSRAFLADLDNQFLHGEKGLLLTKPIKRPVGKILTTNAAKNKYASVIAHLEKKYQVDPYEVEARRLGAIDVSDNGVSSSFASARASLSLFMKQRRKVDGEAETSHVTKPTL